MNDDTSLCFAPWTKEQVRALNVWQNLGHVPEFTCGLDACNAALVATRSGWICPLDDYKQNWAHVFMADVSRHPPNLFEEKSRTPEQSAEEEEDEDDRRYIAGGRAAWGQITREAARHLGVEDPLGRAAFIISGHESVIGLLRRACEEHGDNDWPDDLNLCDILDKHLLRYL